MCRDRGPRRLQLSALLLWLAVLSGSDVLPAYASVESDALRLEGFELAYNLDHDAAMAMLLKAVEADPNDPATHRSLAAVTWLHVLFRRGTVLVDDYLGGLTRPRGDRGKPPADLARLFERSASRALELAEQRVDRAENDPDAQYELGAVVGLMASYEATIEGDTMDALRAARRAYQAHEKVLDLDPSRKDAGLVVGTYRYLTSILPWPLRVLAYLVGFEGGKDEALRLIEEAAAFESAAQTEAQFALVLMYNREKRYDDALRVLHALQRQYPRNRLIWLEEGSTLLRADDARRAAAALTTGYAMFERDSRMPMFGERAIWQVKLAGARVALGRRDEARQDLEAVLAQDANEWVHGRARLELGKLADLAGERAQARAQYRRAIELCESGKDSRCVAEAEKLRDTPYTGVTGEAEKKSPARPGPGR